jgi:hypothetical protein
VIAEAGEDTLDLHISIPGIDRSRKVYQSSSGNWYFNDKSPEFGKFKRRIVIGYAKREEILETMKLMQTDYINLPCTATEDIV